MKKLFVLWSLVLSLVGISSPARAVDLLTTAENVFYHPDDTRVGIEVEFSGLSIQETANLVAKKLGGTVSQRKEIVKTTIKKIKADGTRIYNEEEILDYVINTPTLGEIILKLDNNMVSETGKIKSKNTVIEIVTAPIRDEKLTALQGLMRELKLAGAVGTSPKRAVSIQMNTEIAAGKLENVDWAQIVNVCVHILDIKSKLMRA